MADITLRGGATAERATGAAYHADDYIIEGAASVEVWLDDEAVNYDVRIQVVGRAAVEKPVVAGNSFWWNTDRGKAFVINVKSDAAANMQLLVG